MSGVRSTDNGQDGINAYTSDFVRVTDGFFVNNFRNGVLCGASCSVQNSTASTNLSGVNAGATSNVLGNVLTNNRRYGIFSFAFTGAVGSGNNTIIGNAWGPTGGNSPVTQLHPNVCDPACP